MTAFGCFKSFCQSGLVCTMSDGLLNGSKWANNSKYLSSNSTRGVHSRFSVRCLEKGLEIIGRPFLGRISSIWFRNYKILKIFSGRNLEYILFFSPCINFIHSVKNNLFCRIVLHLTSPTYHCLGNKTKNKLETWNPTKYWLMLLLANWD